MQKAAPSLQSPEDLLNRLAPSVRQGFLLAYDSHSNQAGTTEFPRIILRNADATLLLSMTGTSTLKGGNFVEVIGWTLTGYRFAELTFSEGCDPSANPAPETRGRFDDSGTKCQGCHNQRPNWLSSPFWPGFFGSEVLLGPDARSEEIARKESSWLKPLVDETKWKSETYRYHTLTFADDEVMWPQDPRGTFLGHNQNFTRLLLLNQSKLLANLIVTRFPRRQRLGNVITKPSETYSSLLDVLKTPDKAFPVRSELDKDGDREEPKWKPLEAWTKKYPGIKSLWSTTNTSAAFTEMLALPTSRKDDIVEMFRISEHPINPERVLQRVRYSTAAIRDNEPDWGPENFRRTLALRALVRAFQLEDLPWSTDYKIVEGIEGIEGIEGNKVVPLAWPPLRSFDDPFGVNTLLKEMTKR